MKNLFFSISFLCLLLPLFAQNDFADVQIEAVKVTDQLYMLKGAGGNIGVSVGPDGILMIDSQFAPLSDKIKATIATIDEGEIRFLVNTHLHGDHLGGNLNFAESGSIIVAQEEVRKRISVEQFNKMRNTTTPPVAEAARPVITFTKDLQFHFNGDEIAVYHGASAHTDGDAVVFFKKANVIHTGDVFVRYGFPYIDVSSGGSVTGMVEFLDEILTMIDDKTVVMPGHGELATKADVQLFRDRIKEMSDKVVKMAKKGKDLGQILEANITAKYDAEWSGDFVNGETFVTLMYHSLENGK